MRKRVLKLNFKSESFINLIIRIHRALSGRLKGKIYSFSNAFSGPRPKGLYFGSTPKIINSKSIEIGENVHFGINPRIECYDSDKHQNKIKIKFGDNTSFGDYFHIGAINSIKLGCNILGGSNILIVDHNHGDTRKELSREKLIPPRERPLQSHGPIIIEDNVWIADNVKILSGVTIGEGSILGTGVIVSRSIPARTVLKK